MATTSNDNPTFGDWLLEELRKEYRFETTGWAPERVCRVAKWLQGGRPESERLIVHVFWSRVVTAFTAPGRHIFISRRLLERLPHDDAAALIVAHEIAHHDLGHVDLFPEWMAHFARVRGSWLVAAAARAVERRLYGPERECAADRHGLELCVGAGYKISRCMKLFDVLAAHLLDMRRDDLVYGPDSQSDEELSEDAPFWVKARLWTWQRAKGYLPVQDRAAALWRYADTRRNMASNHR